MSARKPVTIEHRDTNLPQVQQDVAASEKDAARLARIVERYGEGMPFDRARAEAEARFYMGQSAEAMLEAGKRLVLLKEHLPHGDFLESLERIGLEQRIARHMMRAAVKFLGPNRKTFSDLGKAKLYELAFLDDDQLEELADGGTVADLHLDKIRRMSVRELQATLAKEREEYRKEREVHERLIEGKNRKLDELDAKLTRRETAAPSARYQALVDELWQAVAEVGGPLLKLEQVYTAIGEIEATDNIPESLDLARGQTLAFLVQALIDMQARHLISADLNARVNPPWQKAA